MFDARASVKRHGISVLIGGASVLLAVTSPIEYLKFAGLLFFLLGPAHGAHGAFGHFNGRRRKRLEGQQRLPSAVPTPAATSAGAPVD